VFFKQQQNKQKQTSISAEKTEIKFSTLSDLKITSTNNTIYIYGDNIGVVIYIDMNRFSNGCNTNCINNDKNRIINSSNRINNDENRFSNNTNRINNDKNRIINCNNNSNNRTIVDVSTFSSDVQSKTELCPMPRVRRIAIGSTGLSGLHAPFDSLGCSVIVLRTSSFFFFSVKVAIFEERRETITSANNSRPSSESFSCNKIIITTKVSFLFLVNECFKLVV